MGEEEKCHAPGEVPAALDAIRQEMGRVLVGQGAATDAMLVCLMTGGHLLLEGMPGLAKTLAVKTLAAAVGGTFSRLQFTPDLLPSDILGTTVYLPEEKRFETRLGPIAGNIVLADEVNRAPAKVQSALLEAMEERQVTIGGRSFPLPEPFFVAATRNPAEHGGTYPLPEAQMDRFMLQVVLDYPEREQELEIVQRRCGKGRNVTASQAAGLGELAAAGRLAAQVRMESCLLEYVVDLVVATRPGQGGRLSARQRGIKLPSCEYVESGASPRASIAMVQCARAFALISGRNYVLPEDVKKAARYALPHRIRCSFAADARGLSSGDIVELILDEIAAP